MSYRAIFGGTVGRDNGCGNILSGLYDLLPDEDGCFRACVTPRPFKTMQGKTFDNKPCTVEDNPSCLTLKQINNEWILTDGIYEWITDKWNDTKQNKMLLKSGCDICRDRPEFVMVGPAEAIPKPNDEWGGWMPPIRFSGPKLESGPRLGDPISSPGECINCVATVLLTGMKDDVEVHKLEVDQGIIYSIGCQTVMATVTNDPCNCIAGVFLNSVESMINVEDGETISVSVTLAEHCSMIHEGQPICDLPLFDMAIKSGGKIRMKINLDHLQLFSSQKRHQKAKEHDGA